MVGFEMQMRPHNTTFILGPFKNVLSGAKVAPVLPRLRLSELPSWYFPEFSGCAKSALVDSSASVMFRAQRIRSPRARSHFLARFSPFLDMERMKSECLAWFYFAGDGGAVWGHLRVGAHFVGVIAAGNWAAHATRPPLSDERGEESAVWALCEASGIAPGKVG